MSKVAVVYWSGTGNTQAMAEAIARGVQDAGGDVSVYTAGEFDSSQANSFDAIAFGCPAMGAEVLEESEFEPMFESCDIKDKKLGLFGSYGWGDGEWMRNWEDSCRQSGANIVCDSIICNDAPDNTVISDCVNMGKTLNA